jgi:P27 family predicted phage terminase small subunit
MARHGKPIEMKLIDGTYQQSVDGRKMQVDSMDGVPERPEKITHAKAVEFWDTIIKTFKAMGMLKEIDVPSLELMILEYQRYWQADEKVMSSGGEIITLKNKVGEPYPTVNPYIKLRQESLKNFTAISQRFGLTPADRTKIQMGNIQDAPINRFRPKDF